MAQLIVRNLEDDVRDRLRELARKHGQSMEEEVRAILRAAVVDAEDAGPQRLGTFIRDQFANCHLEANEAIPEWRGRAPRPAEFE